MVLKRSSGRKGATFSALMVLFLGFAVPPAHADATYLLQLGSFPTKEAATERWEALQKDYSAELQGLDHRLADVAIGQGRFIWRLQAGPLPAKAEATSRCAALTAAKQDCYLVETAVLNKETPTQALSNVRATDAGNEPSGELQLGKTGDETAGIARFDDTLPRMKEAETAAPVSAKSEEEAIKAAEPETKLPDTLPDEKAVTETEAPRIAFSDAPKAAPETDIAMPAIPEPTLGTATEANLPDTMPDEKAPAQQLAKAPESEAMAAPAPSPVLPRMIQTPPPSGKAMQMGMPASDTLQPPPSMDGSAAMPVADEATKMPVVVAPTAKSAAKTKNKTAAQTAPAPTSEMFTADSKTFVAPATSPMGSLGTLRMNAQGQVVGATDITRSRPVGFGAPAASATKAAPFVASAAPMENDASGTITPSHAKDVKVEVSEAVRVKDGENLPEPAASVEGVTPPEPPITVYAPPAAWRGTPSSATPSSYSWVQFGQFVQEDAAFAYFDSLRAQHPDLTNGVRVRALRPYGGIHLGSHVALRVGPYRSEEEVARLCAIVEANRMPCKSVQEIGGSGIAASTRSTDGTLVRSIDRQTMAAKPSRMPFGKPSTPLDGTFTPPSAAAIPTSPNGKFMVQLGSYPSQSDAYNNFSTLQGRFPNLFTGLSPNVSTPAHSSALKNSYRLRVGPFSDQTAAMGFCSTLGQNGLTCLIVDR